MLSTDSMSASGSMKVPRIQLTRITYDFTETARRILKHMVDAHQEVCIQEMSRNFDSLGLALWWV